MRLIPGTTTYYCDEEGNIYSSNYHREGRMQKLKTANLNTSGYPQITLIFNDKRCVKTVHRLVASAYLKNFGDSKLQVNHIDGNKLNNSVSNLEMVTASENRKHAFKLGLSVFNEIRGEKNGKSSLKESEVLAIRSAHSREIMTQAELAKLFKTSDHCIWSVVTRRTWKHI